MLTKVFEKPNTIHVSIGEEGIVAAYFVKQQLVKKLFVRSVDEKETLELRKILLNDPNASIHIYIDILDQSYVQRTLPAINVFSVNNLARARLEKETPKNHLKGLLQVGRTEEGRKDWVYVFISSPLEAPVSTWVQFFERYQNVIHGIHFLPAELHTVVKAINKKREASNGENANKLPWYNKFLKKKSVEGAESTSVWELLLTYNKTGGFRQAAFQDGKVIFTRLLNSITDPNPDVVAGSIEQEISNSLEYLRRLSIKEKVEVHINIFVPYDIKRNIRRNKFNAKEVHIYSPFEAARVLNLPPEVTNESDRFSDPLVLALLHQYPKRLITVHTEQTRKVFQYTQLFNQIVNGLKVAVPLIFIGMMLNVYNILVYKEQINDSKFREGQLRSSLEGRVATKNSEDKKFNTQQDIEKIQEIADLYNQFEQYNTNPVTMLQKLGSIRTDIARVSAININHEVPQLKYTPSQNDVGYEKNNIKQFSLKAEFEVKLEHYGNSYEELIKNYNDYADRLKSTFPDHDIELSALPQNFTFEDFKKAILLKLKIQYPLSNKG